jgi:hypothetical protein
MECRDLIDTFNKLRINSTDNVTDTDMNDAYKTIEKWCPSNDPKCNEILEIDKKLLTSYYKNNLNVYVKGVIIELFKRQLQELLSNKCNSFLCRKKDSLTSRLNCSMYRSVYLRLNLVSNRTYGSSNSQFISDMDEALELIWKIYNENLSFIGIHELINIDSKIQVYVKTNETDTETRRLITELIISQLNVLISILCNFCQEKFSFNFDLEKGDQRLPYGTNQSDQCKNTISYARQANTINNEIDTGKGIEPRYREYVRCVLTGKFREGDQSLNKPENLEIEKKYADWVINKVETKSLTDKERNEVISFFRTNQGLRDIYIKKTLKRFILKLGIQYPEKEIREYEDLNPSDFIAFYNIYLVDVVRGGFIDSHLSLKKREMQSAAIVTSATKSTATTNIKKPPFRGGERQNLHELLYRSAKITYLLSHLNKIIE